MPNDGCRSQSSFLLRMESETNWSKAFPTCNRSAIRMAQWVCLPSYKRNGQRSVAVQTTTSLPPISSAYTHLVCTFSPNHYHLQWSCPALKSSSAPSRATSSLQATQSTRNLSCAGLQTRRVVQASSPSSRMSTTSLAQSSTRPLSAFQSRFAVGDTTPQARRPPKAASWSTCRAT